MSTPEAADVQEPSEEKLRAAYEAELARISSTDMILQAAASLLNIGALRLGLVGDVGGSSTKVERDLEQVRDAIDGVRALLPIIERREPQQLRPLRDALAQLQMAYTREVQSGAPSPGETAAPAAPGASAPPASTPPAPASPAGEDPAAQPRTPTPQEKRPGPAEASGRLWVPGR